MALTIPDPLLQAILSAGQAYEVEPLLLTGVWIIESGGNYPNLAVNSLGYGGLFGTKLWNAPAQDQANLAASTLADLYARFGSWDAALHEYSSGTTSGGYGLDRVYAAAQQFMLTPEEHQWLHEVVIYLQRISTALGIVPGGTDPDQVTAATSTAVTAIVADIKAIQSPPPATIDLSPVTSRLDRLINELHTP